MMMVMIFCFVLILSQGTLSASLPESSHTPKNLESVFKDLFTGITDLSNEFSYEATEDEIPENEEETKEISIPGNEFGL